MPSGYGHLHFVLQRHSDLRAQHSFPTRRSSDLYYRGERPLSDEVHTSDSSRYFYLDGYQRRFDNNLPQKQLSKEFLREWLMDKGFRGQPGDPLPDLPDSFRWSIYQRYAELYETITDEKWAPARVESLNEDLNRIFSDYLRD